MLQIGNYFRLTQYEYQTYNVAKHEFQVKKLNIFQCIARKLLGWYAETHFNKVTKAFADDWKDKGVSDFTATTKQCSMRFTFKLVNQIQEITRLFEQIQSKKSRALVVPEVEEELVGEVDPNVILSGKDPLVHATPNSGPDCRGKMFGVAHHRDCFLVELNPEQVETRPLTEGEIHKRKQAGITDTNVVMYRTKDEGNWGDWQPSTKEGLPNRLLKDYLQFVDFHDSKHKSYSDDIKNKDGFPIYPYWNRKDIDQSNPVMQLPQPGANHVTDSGVFKIDPATGNLQLAVFYQPHERVWALSRSLVKDHIYTAITPFAMDYENEKPKNIIYERWELLRFDTNWTDVFKGILPNDPGNTKHSWKETKVQAFLIPKDKEDDWKKVRDNDEAKWLTLTPELIEDWAKGKGKLHHEHTSLAMLTLLNPAFQYKLIAAAKEHDNKDAAKHLAKLMIAAERHAEKLGLAN